MVLDGTLDGGQFRGCMAFSSIIRGIAIFDSTAITDSASMGPAVVIVAVAEDLGCESAGSMPESVPSDTDRCSFAVGLTDTDLLSVDPDCRVGRLFETGLQPIVWSKLFCPFVSPLH